MLCIGWFSTGRGEGSRGLLRFVQERLTADNIDARIDFVFSNRGPGEAEGSDAYFDLVRSFGLPLITKSSMEFRRRTGGTFADHREEFDTEALELVAGRRPDICVLAGYMLIASPLLCRSFPLLNLHPALPDGPTGTWQEVVWQLMDQRATCTGAMTHLATEEVDRGPLVSYVRAPLDTPPLQVCWEGLGNRDVSEIRDTLGEDYQLFRMIRAEQYRREPHLLLETVRAIACGEIALDVNSPGREVSVAGGAGSDPAGYGGLCLDGRVEESMRRSTRA